MLTTVPVALGERSYDIRIGPNLLRDAGTGLKALKIGLRGVIITDETVAPLYGESFQTELRAGGFDVALCAVPAGEKSKNLDQVATLYDKLLDAKLDRTSFVIALGGGVVGDLAGHVAATFLRGIPYVQIPTTLLAQVDSSVGGKVGVNLPRGKNLVGAFYQPRLVLVDTKTLETLPMREYRAGLAEVIKYGIIYDAALFDQLEKEAERVLKRDLTLMEKIVARCCQIKADLVSKDEREDGLRAILNYGHTIGHAIEAVTQYGACLHGEAIAVGMMLASRLSQRRGHLSAIEVARIQKIFERYGFDLSHKSLGFDSLLTAMRLDKKSQAGKMRFVLAKKIGEVFLTDEVTEADVREVLK
ncbi:MAG: 3-dehydroquinate synthase [Verrucomicrobiae bacterium]|nr:3-dehydroquinate synthase [Verrucomicrobiae bacterium]